MRPGCMDPTIGQDSLQHRANLSRPDAVDRKTKKTQIRRKRRRSAAAPSRRLQSAPILAGPARAIALVAQTCSMSRVLSSVKLNDVEADAIARSDQPDHLDIDISLR